MTDPSDTVNPADRAALAAKARSRRSLAIAGALVVFVVLVFVVTVVRMSQAGSTQAYAIPSPHASSPAAAPVRR
jgi:hypothetical protein